VVTNERNNMSDIQLPPVSEQTGPPPLVEELTDTNDLPEGYELPEQVTTPDFEFDGELDDTEEKTV
jgi:hypothetical protein